jgi:hypothetical protein
MTATAGRDIVLGLRPGDWVEVKSESEILATLDADGAIGGQLFMPEMRQYCGQRFQVQARADKTCDTVTKTGGRRMYHTVHLPTRCDGGGHGGCQAACLLFWKEAWLRRVDGPGSAAPSAAPDPELARRLESVAMHSEGTPDSVRYRCQATDLVKASTLLAWWDVRQFWRDWWSGGVSLGRMVRVFAVAAFNFVQIRRGGGLWPRLPSVPPVAKTPTARLNLQAGELVRIKGPREIAATLDAEGRNRGMRFDVAEMTQFCNGTFRVRQRVQRIIDENTGKMLELANPCIQLENVVCSSNYSAKRYFCPRAIYPYWREIWLERVEGDSATVTAGGQSA